MSTPPVGVVSCGGTIAAEPDHGGGATPAKSGQQLLEAVPELRDIASVESHDVCSRPGFDMAWGDVLATANRIRELLADSSRELDGIVVTHGTDTLADTAYALELIGEFPVPIVVTGAQRRFDEPSSDAPANLIAAVRAAVDDRFSSGVHVAFDQQLHAARDVVKAHTSALDTFRSPGKGPVATLTRERRQLHREPRRRVSVPPLGPVSLDAIPRIPVVHSGTGVGREAIEALDVSDGTAREGTDRNPVGGVVVEGTGLGNVTGELGEAITALASSVPVVAATRCYAGTTEPVYGTPGGAVTLEDAGVAFAGDLSTAKARVKLALGLAVDHDVDDLFSVSADR